jgi:hypothetical protein
MLGIALYIRDVNGLAVPVGGDVPPALGGVSPAANAGPPSAAAQWRTWWQALLDLWLATEERASDPVDSRSRMRELIAARLAVFDPPEFDSLAGSPELRELLRSGATEASRWFARRRGSPTGTFDYEIIRSVAEEVARVHDVSPDAVRASAQVLPVEGVWWQRVRPRAVLCSVAAARDPATSRVALRDAFESGLGG